MLGCNHFIGKRAAIGTLVFVACSGAAAAQSSPPPAVTVSPVASRQVTETGTASSAVSWQSTKSMSSLASPASSSSATSPKASRSRPATCCSDRAGHLQGGGRSAERQSRQGQGYRGQYQFAVAARPGAGEESEHSAIDGRPARRRRASSAGRRAASTGPARAGARSISAIPKSARRSTAGSGLPILLWAILSARRRERWPRSSARIRST